MKKGDYQIKHTLACLSIVDMVWTCSKWSNNPFQNGGHKNKWS